MRRRRSRDALRYSLARTPDKRRPGQIPGKNPGPSTCSRGTRTRSRCLYARYSRRCPALRAGCMGASQQSYRLYSCRGCARQVRICRRCDRGNQYCAGPCARQCRRESLRRAGARYQSSYRGACRHAARQRRWRVRWAQKVTHQGSPEAFDALIVAARLTATPGNDAGCAVTSPLLDSAPWVLARGVQPRARCCFCGRWLSRFARLGPLRGAP
jgi:hypothetical protein